MQLLEVHWASLEYRLQLGVNVRELDPAEQRPSELSQSQPVWCRAQADVAIDSSVKRALLSGVELELAAVGAVAY